MRPIVVILTVLIFFIACKHSDNRILEIKKLPHYPSASAIEYDDAKFYLMGDDSRNMLILNETLEPVDSISLYEFEGTRMPKPTKADIEAMTLFKKQLLLLGSGSLLPYRSGGWLIEPGSKTLDTIRLDKIYDRLQHAGLTILNIEGVCSIPGWLILANRGNYGWRNNHLVVLPANFIGNQDSTELQLIRLGGNMDTSLFNGVSGLAYAKMSDKLLVSVSTEQTSSSTGDGPIGKSYLWIINNITSKKNWRAINPNTIIDLEDLDPAFAGQKIESVCVVKETKRDLELMLAADNDDGSSALFKVRIKK